MVANHSKHYSAAAFTLRELIVVIAMGTLLLGVLISAMHQSTSRRVKQMQCAANLRQFAQAVQLYASENREALPSGSAGLWAWDLPSATADSLLRYGMERRDFYCPGTAPRFNDQLNYLNPGFSSLWNFGYNFRIIGYLTTFPGTAIGLTNQNRTILPEPPKLNALTDLPIPKNSERVLLADATISENAAGTPSAPIAAGSFTSVVGGLSVNGRTIPHLSPHLKGNLPAGGTLAYKDGHVAWRPFSEMSQRATSGRGFWW